MRVKTALGGSLLGLDFAARQAARDAAQDARDKTEKSTEANGASTVEDPAAANQLTDRNRRPNTFINQLPMSLFTRLASGGSAPRVVLTTNFCTEGPRGEIFNQLFYNGQLKFRKTTRTRNPQYEAMTDFLWWVGHEFEQRMTPADLS